MPHDETKTKAVYLCGPMTGLPEYNIPVFKEVAAAMRELGLRVISPAEINQPDDGNIYEQWLRRDLCKMVDECSVIAYLPGWRASHGATLELLVARSLGFDFIEVELDPIKFTFGAVISEYQLLQGLKAKHFPDLR